jgi:hypothetical protein
MTKLAPRERLCAEINELHQKIERSSERGCDEMRCALEAAKKAGGLLIEIKKVVGHGNWSAWLSSNFHGSERTAQRYIAVSKSDTPVSEFQNLSMREVYRKIGKTTDNRPLEEGKAPPLCARSRKVVGLLRYLPGRADFRRLDKKLQKEIIEDLTPLHRRISQYIEVSGDRVDATP